MARHPRPIGYPFDLSEPGGLDDLMAWHRAMFGDTVMVEDGAGAGAGGGGEAGASGGTAGGGESAGGDGGQQQTGGQASGGEASKTFTQADLDRIVGERVAAEKAKHEKALKDAQDLAGKNELEKAQLEKTKAEERATEITKTAAQRIARTEAKVAALAAGAKPDRVEALIKQADLTGAISDDGDVDDAKVKAAVEKALTAYPEWKAAPGTQRSGGDLGGGGGGDKPTFTRKQIEDMAPEELARRIDEVNDALADGRVTG